jgi:DNA-binding transcriptional regulator YdaS (Cro superfamily)
MSHQKNGTYFMHHYWLGVAIRLCGPTRECLGKLIGVTAKRITYWLNDGKRIPLEYAIKIENVVHGRVTRFQLAPYLDKQSKKTIWAEYQAAQSIRSPLTFSEKVALGLAIEAELGDRQGIKIAPLLREKFPEVKAIWGDFSSADAVFQGRTEEIAAHYTKLGSYKSYQKAKRIMQFGVSELIQVMNGQSPLPIDRADKVARNSPEKQQYLLSLKRKQMIRELETFSNQTKKEDRYPKENKTNRPILKSPSDPVIQKIHLKENLFEKFPPNSTGYLLTMTWALLSFVSVLESEKKRSVYYEQNQNSEAGLISA